MANKIQLGRKQELFAVAETTWGTIAEPAITDAILLSGTASHSQSRAFAINPEKNASRSPLIPVAGKMPHGTFSFNFLARPSGTAGTAPMENNIMEAFWGVETNNVGTSEVFSFGSTAEPKPMSIWMKQDEWVFVLLGSLLDELSWNWKTDALGEFSVSGGFQKHIWTGTAIVPGAIANVISVTLTAEDEHRFCVGSRINVNGFVGAAAKVNTKAIITNIDPATHILTITAGAGDTAFDAGAIITAWMPASATVVGNPVHGYIGICQLGGGNFLVESLSGSIKNNISWVETEKDGTIYPTGTVTAANRELTGSADIIARGDDLKYFYQSENLVAQALKFVLGTTAGSIVEINYPQILIEPPTVSGDDITKMAINFKIYATSALNDEATLTYK